MNLNPWLNYKIVGWENIVSSAVFVAKLVSKTQKIHLSICTMICTSKQKIQAIDYSKKCSKNRALKF
jgi:hypothetical protein